MQMQFWNFDCKGCRTIWQFLFHQVLFNTDNVSSIFIGLGGGVEVEICLQTWEFDKPRKSKDLSSILLAVIVESIAN